jgi:hypothetical protein
VEEEHSEDEGDHQEHVVPESHLSTFVDRHRKRCKAGRRSGN